MKLALAQLKKLNFPYENNEIISLKDSLNGFEDILNSSDAKIKSIINQINDEEYTISFDINIELIVEDAVSLKPIKQIINSKGKELFSTNPKREDAFIIEGNTLDTKEAILMLILSEKPMSSTNEEFIDEIDEDTDNINPAFASLKELL